MAGAAVSLTGKRSPRRLPRLTVTSEGEGQPRGALTASPSLRTLSPQSVNAAPLRNGGITCVGGAEPPPSRASARDPLGPRPHSYTSIEEGPRHNWKARARIREETAVCVFDGRTPCARMRCSSSKARANTLIPLLPPSLPNASPETRDRATPQRTSSSTNKSFLKGVLCLAHSLEGRGEVCLAHSSQGRGRKECLALS